MNPLGSYGIFTFAAKQNPMEQILFYMIIAILLFDYLLERLLDYLNSTRWSNRLPDALKGIYDAEKYSKAQDYQKTKTRFPQRESGLSIQWN